MNLDIRQGPTLTPRSVESTAGSLVDIDVAVRFVSIYTKTGISGTEELVYASTALSAVTASRAGGVIALVYVRFDGTEIIVGVSRHLSALEMASWPVSSYSVLAWRGNNNPHQIVSSVMQPHVGR